MSLTFKQEEAEGTLLSSKLIVFLNILSGAEQMNVVGVVCGVIFTAVITTVIIAVTISKL